MAWKARAGVKWLDAEREVNGILYGQRERRGEGVGPRERRPRAKLAGQPIGICTRQALAAALALGLVLASAPAMGQQFTLINGALQKRVDSVLTVMQYTLFPDVTTSALSITSGTTGNPSFGMTQFGGGFTVSKSFPLYLEGNAALSRFDPKFIATDGTEQRDIPTKWTTLTGTVGIGWDFPIAPELVLRPIANFMLGHMETDISAAAHILGLKTGKEIDFLEKGQLNAVGFGGSLMLDYEHYRRDYDIDVELRYTGIYLENLPGTWDLVKGETLAQNLNLWTRWRAPTGLTALDAPVRYVLEFAYSYYFGNQDDGMGFNHLFSVGGGLELDTSAHSILWISRIRLIARYRFGENVSGYTISLGISF